jgi:AcrR family transcriptional regulator
MTIDKRDHILDIAEKLFSEQGFEGTSTRQLASEAGVNLAMISYYFGSKEKLFEELVVRRTSYMSEMLKALNESGTDPWERLHRAIDMYVDKIFSNMNFHRIIHREISLQQRSAMSTTICDILFQNAKELCKIIQDGIDKKVFREVDVPLSVASLVGSISQASSSSNFFLRMIGLDPETNSIVDEPHKQRLKAHLKNLFKAHLQIPQN